MLSFQFLPFDKLRKNYLSVKAEEFARFQGIIECVPKSLREAYQFIDDIFTIIQRSSHDALQSDDNSSLSAAAKDFLNLNLSQVVVGAMLLVAKLDGLKDSIFNININKIINANENNILDEKSSMQASRAVREFKLKNNVSYLQPLASHVFLKLTASVNGLVKINKNSLVQVKADKLKFPKPANFAESTSYFDETIKEFSKGKEFVLPCDVPQKAT